MDTSNKNIIKCDHVWYAAGLWDGRTPQGAPTGGILYVCRKCNERATSKDEINKKGGVIDNENSRIKSRE